MCASLIGVVVSQHPLHPLPVSPSLAFICSQFNYTNYAFQRERNKSTSNLVFISHPSVWLHLCVCGCFSVLRVFEEREPLPGSAFPRMRFKRLISWAWSGIKNYLKLTAEDIAWEAEVRSSVEAC